MKTDHLSSSSDRGRQCPSCGAKGRPVNRITLESLLKPEALARATADAYRFCPSENCEVVYFAQNSPNQFHKADLTVRVGIKETEPPRHICYCFDHTVEEIEREVRLTGRTTVLDDIKTRMKEACWCETKSPLGACCLATVTQYVKAAEARHGATETAVAAARKVEDCCAAGGGNPKAPRAHADRDEKTGVSQGERVAWIGSVVSAVVASVCCWLPLLLIAAGVSGVAVSSAIEKYRPFFIVVTFGFLGAAFYLAYRPRKVRASDASGQSCCPPASARDWTRPNFNKAMLWGVTLVAIAFLFFPSYAGWFLGAGDSLASRDDLDKVALTISGMTCESCAVTLEKQLAALPPVEAAEVSYATKKALIGLPKGAPAPRQKILAAIRAAGFDGRFTGITQRIVPIEGMTCDACAVSVKAHLAKVPGVTGVEVSYEKKRAVVLAEDSVSPDAITKAVEASGYRVPAESKPAAPNE